MQEILSVFSGIALVITIFGGGLSSIVFGYAGIQWMIAAGDPQKQAQARSALFGAFVGLIIVGVAFLIPGIISQVIIEPAGGAPIVTRSISGCDQQLQRQLVVTSTATNAPRMQALIGRIQAQREACGPDSWDPTIYAGGDVDTAASSGDGREIANGCYKTGPLRVNGSGDFPIPPDLILAGKVRKRVGIGPDDNIVIYFGSKVSGSWTKLPSSGSACWVYSRALDTWAVSAEPR